MPHKTWNKVLIGAGLAQTLLFRSAISRSDKAGTQYESTVPSGHRRPHRAGVGASPEATRQRTINREIAQDIRAHRRKSG